MAWLYAGTAVLIVTCLPVAVLALAFTLAAEVVVDDE